METITITFCDVAENGPGMEKIGALVDPPFSCEVLRKLSDDISKYKTTEIYNLHRPIEATSTDLKPICEKASVLVIRNYLDNPEKLFKELTDLEWDKKALMRGRVKNKLARHNLCFADFNQEADYENGKGTVHKFADLPNLQKTRECIISDFGLQNVVAEGNRYYDLKRTRISPHGDVERNFVIGLRLGAPMDLSYQWYYQTNPVSDKVTIMLNSGDLYIMSNKATGKDWRKRSQYTLRHSANCEKNTIKPVSKK